MSSSEFALIERLFKGAGGSSKSFTRLGIGDDASIHHPQPGMDLVISTDTSVQGVHWPDNFPLDKAADRAICSALSDLAAMGAECACVWLNVMAEHSRAVELMALGISAALQRHDIELGGGDTCRSATNALSVTVAGQLPLGTAMRRDAARDHDRVWLSGRLGFHALGLQQWMHDEPEGAFVSYFERIVPRIHAGIRLRKSGVHCCIDVSDGLKQDAAHLAVASGIGMDIEVTSLPGWTELSDAVGAEHALQLIAHGGEDYALLFTAPAGLQFSDDLAVCIGQCRAGSGVSLFVDGQEAVVERSGYDHFA